MYSYSLRKVAVGATRLVHEHLSDDDERESEEEPQEPHAWSCPAGVGISGARGLRGKRAVAVRDEHRKHARRPSSAPVERSCSKVSSQRRRQHLSHRPKITARDATRSAAACGRARRNTAPANWGAAEAGDVWTGLVS